VIDPDNSDNTQHSQETDVHAPDRIWTSSLSKREAADPRFRPRGHWDRQTSFQKLKFSDENIAPNSRVCTSTMPLVLLWDTETVGWCGVLQYESVYTTFRTDCLKVESGMDGLTDMITCLRLDTVVSYVHVYRDEEIGARVQGPILRRSLLFFRHCICKYWWMYKQSTRSKALQQKLQLLRYKSHSMHVTEIGGTYCPSATRKSKEGFATSKYIFQKKSLPECISKEHN
jgi:hypothetical protein